MDIARNLKTHCNSCGRVTNHALIKEDQERGDDEESGFWYINTAQMLKCRGCDEVVLRRIYHFSENDESEVEYFPGPISRRFPHWRYELPVESRLMMEEVYKALQADSNRLAMMGTRTLIDIVIRHKVGEHDHFNEGLKALRKKGFVSPQNIQFLTAALDAGSAAAHRGYVGNTEEVNAVMDIVENLLQSVYVLEDLAEQLEESTPPRQKVLSKKRAD